MLTAEQISRNAKAFTIWREGRAVDWNCTCDDIAEAVKLPVYIVRRIARERGWPVRKTAPGTGPGRVELYRILVDDGHPLIDRETRIEDTDCVD